LHDIKTPQGMTRCPKGLGMMVNGKLKASEWHALFATHLPLAAIDVFIGNYDSFINGDAKPYLTKILLNFCALVECTHIIASRQIKPGYPEKYKQAYYEYMVTSNQLEPGCKIKPNHHYAIHVALQMEWWGPLLGVAEFLGERLCGFLQKINTNGKDCE
ncbi:hypothetical protein CROQUDRAFT_54136, partial [Cronartium quercuum f. sp. fusiforme G11]